MSFSSYLKNQREINQWTIREIANRLGFSSSYISQLENGTRIPSPKKLSTLAKAYRVSEEELKRRWTEAQIKKVSLATNYKFNIKEAGEKRVHEVASRLEESLEELNKTITNDEVEHFKMPVLRTIPLANLDKHLKQAEEFISLPRNGNPNGHRVFGLCVSNLAFPEAGIIAGDCLILDADAKAKDGDIVFLATPDGLVATYYKKRGDYLEIRPEMKGFQKTYPLKEAKMMGKLMYHIKKY